MRQLTVKEEKRLSSVHPDLEKVVRLAIKKLAKAVPSISIYVLEGIRTKARQEELFKAGATRTMNSRHLTGHAIDLGAYVNNKLRWDWPLYNVINAAMKEASEELNIPIEWGGNWRTFKDGPHYQLPFSNYK